VAGRIPIPEQKEQAMEKNSKPSTGHDRRVILSTLWLFAVLNYLYADVFTLFFTPNAAEKAMSFTQGSELAALAFAMLMETAIAMILLSRILPYRINRWANILVALLHSAAVAGSMIGEPPVPFYVFFAATEIACTTFIVWYAWSWRSPQAAVAKRDAEPAKSFSPS
jgi:MFS family permease